MGQPRPLIHIFSSFQTHITNFTIKRYVKKCPPLYGAGIQTHDLWNMSLLHNHQTTTVCFFPIVKQFLLLPFYALSLLFWHFINSTAYHLGRYAPSSPPTKELHVFALINGSADNQRRVSIEACFTQVVLVTRGIQLFLAKFWCRIWSES